MGRHSSSTLLFTSSAEFLLARIHLPVPKDRHTVRSPTLVSGRHGAECQLEDGIPSAVVGNDLPLPKVVLEQPPKLNHPLKLGAPGVSEPAKSASGLAKNPSSQYSCWTIRNASMK